MKTYVLRLFCRYGGIISALVSLVVLTLVGTFVEAYFDFEGTAFLGMSVGIISAILFYVTFEPFELREEGFDP